MERGPRIWRFRVVAGVPGMDWVHTGPCRSWGFVWPDQRRCGLVAFSNIVLVGVDGSPSPGLL